MNTLLEVKNLTVSFTSGKKDLEVVSQISFSIKRGEILALVGESGCGKSASCLALTGLLPVPPAKCSAGGIRFFSGEKDIDLQKLSGAQMRKIRGGSIAYIFQEPTASLNPVMRIGDQIDEVLKLHRPEIRDRKKEIISLLKQVGITSSESRINSYPHELSGGMQQRVMIAMALAGNPELLIADEPTTALDVTVQSQILELLEQLRRERQMAVILISHNLGVVSRLADRIAVMYAGKIVESGTADEVLFSPRHPYTAALLAALPVPGNRGKQLNTIPGFVPPPGKFPAGCRFCGRCTEMEKLPEALKKCCASVVPEQTEFSPTHHASCHRFKESVS
ncbi:MAG: ABC transporter ATP-binding protein [Lentisphaeria bacterium]|nr:ABC transporter ATP-binding protein [Lentisphaeria bacterium]